jgi:hypothetical protein
MGDRLVVAHAAVYRGQSVFMRKLLDVGIFVARDASDIAVYGTGKGAAVHIQREFLAVPVNDEIAIPVTLEAFLVVDGMQNRQAKQRHPNEG